MIAAATRLAARCVASGSVCGYLGATCDGGAALHGFSCAWRHGDEAVNSSVISSSSRNLGFSKSLRHVLPCFARSTEMFPQSFPISSNIESVESFDRASMVSNFSLAFVVIVTALSSIVSRVFIACSERLLSSADSMHIPRRPRDVSTAMVSTRAGRSPAR